MDDFADRTINELVESYPLFVDALKDEYDVISPMIDIILSSGFKTDTGRIKWYASIIVCEAFDCFFEYQIYKIMEKYPYYNKIRTQLNIIEQIDKRKKKGDLKLKSIIYSNSYIRDIFKRLYIHYNRRDDEIVIVFELTHYIIKVEEKYKQDMLNLFEHNVIKNHR